VAAAAGEAVEGDEITQQATAAYRNAMTLMLTFATDEAFEWSSAAIKALHYTMLQYDADKWPGHWRQGPMSVVNELQEVEYVAPDAVLVPALMDELLQELAGTSEAPPMVRAAMAHLNLVMIHPFRDGNGRMARCLQSLVLGRAGTLEPAFSSIEEYLGANTEDYYNALAATGHGAWHPENDAYRWVRFCLTAHYHQAQTFLRRIREGQDLMDQLLETVRTHGLPERTALALWDAAHGFHVRNNTYREVAKIKGAIASRDLMELVSVGLLVPIGEKRGRHYKGTLILQEMRKKAKENRPLRVDPYFEYERPTLLSAQLSVTGSAHGSLTLTPQPATITGAMPTSSIDAARPS